MIYTIETLINFNFQLSISRGVLFLTLLPIVALSMFLIAVGSYPEQVNLAIINNDITAAESCSDLHKTTTEDFCNLGSVSCKFLAELTSGFSLKFYGNISEALKDAKRGKATAIISFNANFSESYSKILLQSSDDIDDSTIDESQIEITMDQTNYVIVSYFKYTIANAYKRFARELGKECNVTNEKLGQSPLVFQTPIFGKFDLDVKPSMIFALIIILLFFTAASLSSFLFLDDRISGCWNRVLLCGVDIVEILAAHIAVQSIVLLVHLAEALLIFVVYFDGLNAQQLLTITFIIIVLQYCGLFVGIGISCITNTIMKSQLALNAMANTMLFISGIMWPTEGMTKILQIFTNLTPFTLSAISMKNVVTKNGHFYHHSTLVGIFVSFIWIVLAILAVMVILKRKKFHRT